MDWFERSRSSLTPRSNCAAASLRNPTDSRRTLSSDFIHKRFAREA